LLLAAVFSVAGAAALAAAPVRPYETDGWSTPANVLDTRVEATLKHRGCHLRPPCSDDVFIRRVYLDLIGTLPVPAEVEAFRNGKRPNKRAALIDSLFTRDEYADYWAMKWADVLRVKSEFPINLWPNAVQSYHHWIRDAIRNDEPYDRFARELLTANGSNFRVPPANFYRAVPSRDPASLAKAVALTFMGTRIERWPEPRRANMAAFFSRVAYKKTDEWKEDIVYPNPALTGPMKVVYPDGTKGTIADGADPREAFANWLIQPGNKWFARNIVNRIWAWTMGEGPAGDPDDVTPGSEPAPEVVACLARELVASHYDLRRIYRLILNSRTYQQSSIVHDDTKDPVVHFAQYKVRRLDAEVLIDALCWIGGDGVPYSSATPEPYTFVPKGNRTIALADGSITSSFLATFGRPARDTGLQSERNNKPSDAQCLYLLNSSDVQRKIQKSPLLRDVASSAHGDASALIRGVYEVVLSRGPTPDESAAAGTYMKANRSRPVQAANDIAWALINSKEFLFRH
jgi:hypothetical protein